MCVSKFDPVCLVLIHFNYFFKGLVLFYSKLDNQSEISQPVALWWLRNLFRRQMPLRTTSTPTAIFCIFVYFQLNDTPNI